MFGGLSMKGGAETSSKEEEASPPQAQAPAPPPAAAPAPASAANGSGFSFLQSSVGTVATAPTPPPAAAAAAAPPTPKPADEAATSAGLSGLSGLNGGGGAGSAFGFLSSGGGSTGTTAAAPALPPAAIAAPAVSGGAAPSMFAGLNAPSSSSSVANSGFGFLSAAATPAVVAPADSSVPSSDPAQPNDAAASMTAPTTTASSSGSSFGFMSGTVGTAAGGEGKDEATVGEAGNLATVTQAPVSVVPVAAGSSSFGFMGGTATAATTTAAGGENEDDDAGETGNPGAEKEPSVAVAPASSSSSGGPTSGFSFLGGAVLPNASSAAAPTSSAAAVPVPPSAVAVPPDAEGGANAVLPPTTAPPPARPPAVDLMSVSNPGLPAGSGVSWSSPPMAGVNATKKKVVKKKRFGKRVGVGSTNNNNNNNPAAAAQATELPAPNAFRPPSIPGDHHPVTPQTAAPSNGDDNNNNSNNNNNFAEGNNSNHPPMMPLTPERPPGSMTMGPMSGTPVHVRAERAAGRADEFMREKQETQRKSAIAMAAERAIKSRSASDASSIGGGGGGGGGGAEAGGWKTGAGEVGETPSSPTDETYRTAKAAADEARKLATSQKGHKGKGKGKGSLFGGFFHRKGTGGSGSGSDNRGGISSLSQHGGVVASPVPNKAFQRGNSNGSVGGLPPTQEKVEVASYGDPRPVEVASYGDPRPAEDATPPAAAGDRDDITEEERQVRLQVQLQEQRRREAELREAAAVEAEIRRRKEERLAREREEEERLAREAEEERLRLRSPRVKMQSALDRLADATRTSTDSVTILRAKRAALASERVAAERAGRRAAGNRELAEARQTRAAEEEDYEGADALAGEIERYEREEGDAKDTRDRIDGALGRLDEEKERAAGEVAKCFREVHDMLRALEKEVDDHEKEEGVLDQFATTSKRLSSERERLANDSKHIERDEEVWKEESKELNGRIEEETKEFVEKSSEASAKLDEVTKTIEDLRRQLAEAETMASDLTAEISTHEQSIEKVKSKYSRQLGRLKKKEDSVRESRWDWESEKESIEKAQAAHEAVVAAHSEDMLSREKLIDDIKSESATAREFEGIVSSAFAYVVRSEGKDDTTTGDADAEVSKHEAAVSEARRNVEAADANIESLEKELQGIEVRLPILQAEKKMAAGKRDFKAAGKASKEIKEATARKERCVAELAGEALERVRSAKEEFRKISATLEEKRTVAAERDREAGLELMELMRGKIVELKSIQRKYATPDSEKFGTERWGEDEGDSITVACVGAFVIESQILVLEAEGKSLGERHGGWDSPDDDVIVEDTSVHSAPTFDSADDGEENDSEIVIDKLVLEKYISMRNSMTHLEAAIEEAAEEEDYDKAAELEEQAATIREEFEAAGFSSKNFERALKDFTNKTSGVVDKAEGSAQNGDNSSEKAIDDSVLKKYASFCAEIKELEAGIETAVADDDFDKAAELEEKIQLARTGIESLGFSSEDIEAALKDRPDTASAGNNAKDDDSLAEKRINESVLDRYVSLCADIKEFKNQITGEDKEKSGDFEEKIRLAKSEIDSLGHSVDDLEEALKKRRDLSVQDDEGEGIDSSDGSSSNNNKDECTDQLNGDDVKMNGKLPQEEEDAT